MPVAEARMQALERIRKMRYGADGYFVVFNRRDFMMNVESGFCCELLVRSW
jgi:signal transduction histidine kinase